MKYYDTSVIVTVLQKSCDTNTVTMESLLEMDF